MSTKPLQKIEPTTTNKPYNMNPTTTIKPAARSTASTTKKKADQSPRPISRITEGQNEQRMLSDGLRDQGGVEPSPDVIRRLDEGLRGQSQRMEVEWELLDITVVNNRAYCVIIDASGWAESGEFSLSLSTLVPRADGELLVDLELSLSLSAPDAGAARRLITEKMTKHILPLAKKLVEERKGPVLVRSKPLASKSEPQTKPANQVAPFKMPENFWVSDGTMTYPETSNYVVVAYQNLMVEHGMSLEDALAVSNAAKTILKRRWPKTRILGSEEGFDWGGDDDFIWLEYDSSIPMKDFDRKNWNNGAYPRPGLQDEIKDQAAKLAGIELPPSLPRVEYQETL
jgi:hypothetical protein